MSLVDQILSAVTPPESQEARDEARAKAYATAKPGDWFSQIMEHHLLLEDAFAAVKATNDEASRKTAQKHLGIVLTGHAIAEESVIYPAMAVNGEKRHAHMGYDEQALVKTEMAALDALPAMSEDYLEKLETIRGAVAHHMYEEEGTWFPDLAEGAPAADQLKLTEKYREEYDRYVGSDADKKVMFEPAPA